MTWVRLDDGFVDHPKIIGLSDGAFRAHVTALCYCGRYLTDGKVPENAAKIVENGAAEELVAVGLWKKTRGGYRIHDYLDYQRSQAEVAEIRERRRAAGRAGGLASAQARAQANRQAKPNPPTPTHTYKAKPSTAAAPPNEKKPREPDPLWDACTEVWGQPANDAERGRRAKAVKLLRQAFTAEGIPFDAALEEIRKRVTRYSERFDHLALPSDVALASRWSDSKPTGHNLLPQRR